MGSRAQPMRGPAYRAPHMLNANHSVLKSGPCCWSTLCQWLLVSSPDRWTSWWRRLSQRRRVQATTPAVVLAASLPSSADLWAGLTQRATAAQLPLRSQRLNPYFQRHRTHTVHCWVYRSDTLWV